MAGYGLGYMPTQSPGMSRVLYRLSYAPDEK